MSTMVTFDIHNILGHDHSKYDSFPPGERGRGSQIGIVDSTMDANIGIIGSIFFHPIIDWPSKALYMNLPLRLNVCKCTFKLDLVTLRHIVAFKVHVHLLRLK